MIRGMKGVPIPEGKVREVAEGLRAIAHEVRLLLLCHLLSGEKCVGELVELTGSTQSNISQHLAKMRMLGIVEAEKRGQHVYYRIAKPELRLLVEALQRIYCPEMCES
ncbi:MAG: transcriptional regulator [Zetaproteobacteria bacterium]|nr:MAG: transcriptional regulator [Zetaproteobacteria bacterium]